MSADSHDDDSGWWDTAKKERSWWQPIARRIVTSGPVPNHVAFVMDGNRRYAKNNGLGSALNGHMKGFQQLAKILEWCQELGVREVSVYAFSIENFKRSDDEVNGLMSLAERKFARLLSERDMLEEKQISFRFFGDIELLSPKLRKLIAQIQLTTRDYTNGIVNVCMPYTSRDEMSRSFELIRQGREKGLLEESQINEWLVGRCLDGRGGRDPDMLVRTSGEKRLSDFMLWQCSSSHVYFEDVLWPDFGYWSLCKAVMSYQYYHAAIQKLPSSSRCPSFSEDESLQPFLQWVDQTHIDRLDEFAGCALEGH